MAMPNWISVSPQGGSGGTGVVVKASANANTSVRSGTLTLQTTSGLTKILSLSQFGRSSIELLVGGSGGYLTKLTI